MMADGLCVTLLGTGTPIPRPDRFGPATLIEAGGQRLLVDAGRGATIRLYQLGVPLGSLDALLITHYHSDHTCGIPDLWLTGWLKSVYARRSSPFRVIGPTGARDLMENLERAYAADIRIRLVDEELPPDGIRVAVEEYAEDGLIYESGGLRAIAFAVDHGDAIKPAYGYRFEYGGRAVVLSSDTRYNANVIRHGTGADLLIHEMAAARPELMQEAHIQRIIAHHTVPRDAGRVFAAARPKLAVYTHLVLPATAAVPPVSFDDVLAETRETYDGPLLIGEDLMRFEIDDAVTVRRWDKAAGADC
ncbi:MAG: MBL fold metallo-hydrolase [Hyphomicrobiales bacterium]|nr:MBL fold metallo-hydrolase [Hyphomicrobiales bacterium]